MLRDFEALVARIMIALIFLGDGVDKLQNPAGTADYMVKVGGFPAVSALPLAYASGAIVLIPAVMLLLGFRSRWAGYVLFLWLIPATFLFHVRHHETIQVLKNLTMMGGLLMVAAYGTGRWGLDRPQTT